MIKSAAHAREILKICDPMTQGWDIADAQSYLAALEGPEVKALVELLDCGDHPAHEEGINCWNCKREKALSQYREAVKP